jgi:GH15 family glucan-1,4-alpha-glucosidase
MPYQRIENYAVIGNLCTAALVSLDSSIDFFCFPEFDSPAIFGALLDPEEGGSFSIRPQLEGMNCKQMYVAETNIVNTRFLSETAMAELTDFMPITMAGQKNQLVRSLCVIHGEVTFELYCRPAFDYARASHRVEVDGQRATFKPECSCPPIALRGTVPLQQANCGVTATFTLREKESAVFILDSPDETSNSGVGCLRADQSDVNPEEVARDLDETLQYWRQWISKSTFRGRWREAVNRSALVLKLLTSRTHGPWWLHRRLACRSESGEAGTGITGLSGYGMLLSHYMLSCVWGCAAKPMPSFAGWDAS